MSEQNDPFFSRHVDEFIERISSASEQKSRQMSPEARLIHDLQSLYSPERKRFTRSLRRVENRLVEQRLARHGGQPASPLSEESGLIKRQAHQGRKRMINDNKPSWTTRFGQRISLLVAILIVTVLVGSFLLVLNYNRHPITITGSGPKPTSTPSYSPGVTPDPTSGATRNTKNLGKIVYTSASMDDFYAFAWSPDSKRIASSTSGKVTIWDATTGKHPLTFTPPGVGGSVLALSWSPDGKYLAAGSGQLYIINPLTGDIIRTFPSSVGLSGGGSALLGAHLPFNGGDMVYATAWSPDGSLMATSLNGAAYGNIIVVWNVSNGQVVYTFRGQTSESGPGSLSWSPDGKYIVSASYAGNVQVWDAHTGKVIFHKNNCGPSAAWAPASMNVVFHCADNTTQVWDVAMNKMVVSRKDSTNTGDKLVWSPDGQEIASIDNQNVVIWDATTGSTVYTFTKQGGQYARALAWSPDGKYIVSGSGNEGGDNHAKVWTAS